jgi:transcriptional regulator of acetoin/glycerol metabolism
MLRGYSWPGNVRELRNVIERAIIVAKGPTLSLEVPRDDSSVSSASTRLVDLQAEHIRSVLDSCGWRIRGERGAARQLGIKPTTLDSRLAKLGIRRQPPQPERPLSTQLA